MPLCGSCRAHESLEVELAATLLYSVSHHSYRQFAILLRAFPRRTCRRSIELGVSTGAATTRLFALFTAGAALRFDLLMDIGGFRDMHRHRRCTQIIQGFTAQHGYETPGAGDLPPAENDFDILAASGVLADYRSAIESAHHAAAEIAAGSAPEAAQSAQYLFPLATRIRSLFKMDFAEAQYISELRSGPAGHFSYRRVAWEMYKAVAAKHPSLARYFRIEDVNEPVNLLKAIAIFVFSSPIPVLVLESS